DPLPGRAAIQNRLTELLSIRSVSAPVLAGHHYLYSRREGLQNQPVLYVRDSLNGADRDLVDANTLAADGTIAHDWFQPSDNGHAYFHLLGSPVETDNAIFGEGRGPEDWPGVSLSNDGRWLLINVSEGWTKSELFLMDLKSDKAPIRLTTGKNFLYSADIYDG